MADERTMIEAALKREGLSEVEWRDGDDGLEAVLKGRWGVIEDDENRGLFSGDKGEVAACVVGAEQYGNQRVMFNFTPEGMDGGEEIRLFDDVEPVD